MHHSFVSWLFFVTYFPLKSIQYLNFSVCHSNKNTNLNPTQKYTYLNFFSNSLFRYSIKQSTKNLEKYAVNIYFISLYLKSRTKKMKSRTKQNLVPTSFFIFSFAPESQQSILFSKEFLFILLQLMVMEKLERDKLMFWSSQIRTFLEISARTCKGI